MKRDNDKGTHMGEEIIKTKQKKKKEKEKKVGRGKGKESVAEKN